MKLNSKILLPQAITILILGCLSVFIINSCFNSLQKMHVSSVVSSAFSSVLNKVNDASKSAQETAALFSEIPEVLEAFKTAHQGNIDDEKSIQSQLARENIRKALAHELNGYKKISGNKLRLHFHLPNGRSLVRLWRNKQTKRSGQWVDISDDISSFRHTVIDVNRLGTPLGGIELGRGGFAIRGVVPVKDESGKILGSAEVLKSFVPILEGVKDAGISAMLFMNKDMLSTATSLRDESKYPIVGKNYVLVSGADNVISLSTINKELLDKSRDKRVVIRHADEAIATMPIHDYRGKQIGVLVGVIDLRSMAGLSAKANITLLCCVAAMLILPLCIILFTVKGQVINPVKQIGQKIKDINEDRADFGSLVDIRFKDEIGDMTTEFNELLGKISKMIAEMQVYVDVVNINPDPIFVVDSKYNFLFANKAVTAFCGRNNKTLKSMKCHDIFKTAVCSTDKCPIKRTQNSGRAEVADIITLKGHSNQDIHIHPMSDVLKDSKGKIVGYIEVARNVTELVIKEKDLNEQLVKTNEVHKSTKIASTQIYNNSELLDKEIGAVNEAVKTQQRLISDTVTAFGQMNASVLDVAENASRASDKTYETRDKAEEGAKVVLEASEAINLVQQQTEIMSKTMDELEDQAHSIGQVLGVINDIADQTNLLALNAAIEAARAGEAGRGFAVVADEVRKLAEKTVQATKEVESVVKGIQSQTKNSKILSGETNSLAVNAAEFATKSGDSLKDIVALVSESASDVCNIASAAEEQSASSEEINKVMEEVNELAGTVAQRVRDSSESLNSLVQLAEELESISNK